MDYRLRAEILVYLLLTMPRAFLLEGSEGQLRQWCLHALLNLASDWNDDDLPEIADHFLSIALRIQQHSGVKVDDDESRFSLTNLDFSVKAEAIDNLFAERQRLISRLEQLNKLLQISTHSPMFDLSVSRTSTREVERNLSIAKAQSDVAIYLSDPGSNALDDQTFARLLSRDTGA